MRPITPNREARPPKISVKLLHALEAQYDFTHAAERALDGHIWVASAILRGMKGWSHTAPTIRRGEDPRDRPAAHRPDHWVHPSKISNRGIAALLGVDEKTVRNAKAKAGIAPAEGKVRDAAGKRRHVDTGSMSSEERRKKIVELSEEGAKQTDIAEILDVSQSTVSDTLRKDRMRRTERRTRTRQDRQHTDFDNADDDQPLTSTWATARPTSAPYIDSFVSQSSDARGAINEMVHLLESDKWQPGGSR